MKRAHLSDLYSTFENAGINARTKPTMLITPATVMNINFRSIKLMLRIITRSISTCEVVLDTWDNASVDQNDDSSIVKL